MRDRFVGAAVGPTIVGVLLTVYTLPAGNAGSSTPTPAAHAFFYAALAAFTLGLMSVAIAYALKRDVGGEERSNNGLSP
ncbi:MAG: hypothetical protein ACXV5B_02575 [Halobacteriota archaeon]